MPHAAIFALVDHRGFQLFVDPAGGLSIPSLALRGPARATASIGDLRESERWLSEDESEGGLLIDRDRKALLIFSGDEIAYQQPLQRSLVRMLERLWSGWRVRWAHRGVADFAAHCGVQTRQPFTRRSPAPVTQADLRRGDDGDNCWVSLRTSRGAVLDVYFQADHRGVDSLTPEIVPAVLSAPRFGPPTEMEVNCGALIDCRFRTLTVWDSAPAASLAKRMSRRWPTWTVRRQYRGWRKQMRETGRSAATIARLAADPATVDRQLRSILSGNSCSGAKIARTLSCLSVAGIA